MANQDVEIAVLQTKVEALTTQLEKLTASVDNLTAMMNRGKGAFAASMFLAGTIGAGVMKGLSYFHVGGGQQ